MLSKLYLYENLLQPLCQKYVLMECGRGVKKRNIYIYTRIPMCL